MSQARIRAILQEMADMQGGGRRPRARKAPSSRRKPRRSGRGIVGGCMEYAPYGMGGAYSGGAYLGGRRMRGGRSAARVGAAKKAQKEPGTWLYLVGHVYAVIKPYFGTYAEALKTSKTLYKHYQRNPGILEDLLDRVDRAYNSAHRKRCAQDIGPRRGKRRPAEIEFEEAEEAPPRRGKRRVSAAEFEE